MKCRDTLVLNNTTANINSSDGQILNETQVPNHTSLDRMIQRFMPNHSSKSQINLDQIANLIFFSNLEILEVLLAENMSN